MPRCRGPQQERYLFGTDIQPCKDGRMNTKNTASSLGKTRTAPEIIDLLASSPSTASFSERVCGLGLSRRLEKKIVRQGSALACRPSSARSEQLTLSDEKELATEVLRYRHLFTELLLGSPKFRQATLSVIQNIYLFNNRKIFFGTTDASTESERQEALLLFSATPCRTSLPLEKTFQHLIIARVWNRIISQPSTETEPDDLLFPGLQAVVEKLNTLRNIYMLLTTGLVRKLAAKTNAIYKESITYHDAAQIGGIGIARASYRYHQSSGVRFSTFAANWVFREIQRQALDGRLIRISTGTVEKYSKAAKAEDPENLSKYSSIIENSTTLGWNAYEDCASGASSEPVSSDASPGRVLEARQMREILLQTIDRILSGKSGDIIKRRFGLPPYQGTEQSVISISKIYRVTRGSIYQLEQAALKKLYGHLRRFSSLPPANISNRNSLQSAKSSGKTKPPSAASGQSHTIAC